MSDHTLPVARLLVVDLDNTLWDWFDAWYSSFTALLEGVHKLTGVPIDELEHEIRPIHQLRGTTEYSALLGDLESLKPFYDGLSVKEYFAPAVKAQRDARSASTKLYPGVLETLQTIKSCGTRIVAYTESLSYWTEWRIKHVGLDGVIDVLYSSPDHDFPAGASPSSLRTLPGEHYGLAITKHLHVAKGILKPSPTILEQIVEDEHISPLETVYVGDSPMKDIAMAQAVGVQDVHAKYGEVVMDVRYDQLRRVSHWPDVTVEKERSGVHPVPNHVLVAGFSELLNIFDFEAADEEAKV